MSTGRARRAWARRRFGVALSLLTMVTAVVVAAGGTVALTGVAAAQPAPEPTQPEPTQPEPTQPPQDLLEAEARAAEKAQAEARRESTEWVSPSPQERDVLQSVAHWKERFDAIEPQMRQKNLRRSKSTDSWDFYSLAYAIDASVAMLEATGDPQYADQALEYVENVVANARPSSSISTSQFKDRYLGWVAQRSDVRGKEVPLFESYCWRYVTRLLRVIRQSPLYEDPEYRDRYQKLLEFTEVNMFEKWYTRGLETHLYRSRTHMASHWAYIAVDLSILTENPFRRLAYEQVFNSINKYMPNWDASLRSQLKVEGSAYFWNAIWGSYERPGQDVAHGNNVISYLVEAHDLGREWTDTDMALFRGTLEKIWPSRGRCAEYVDGTGRGTCWYSDGFVKLGRYDPALQLRLQSHRVQGAQFYATMANNARILADRPAGGSGDTP